MNTKQNQYFVVLNDEISAITTINRKIAIDCKRYNYYVANKNGDVILFVVPIVAACLFAVVIILIIVSAILLLQWR